MKKIISILVALGVILGMTTMAAPVAAAPCVCPTTLPSVTVIDLLAPPFCAGGISNYQVGPYTIPIAYLENTDWFALKFPDGTDLSGVTPGGITLNSAWNGVSSPTIINVVGTELFIKVPAGWGWPVTPANDTLTITVNGVVNPATPDTYCLYAGYMDDCCTATYTNCGEYDVIPYYCTLDLVFDFSPTYYGLAEGFIPPFKACGQECYGHQEAVGWVTDFNLNIVPVVPGCHPPCPTAKLFYVVTKCPASETITLDDGTTTWTLTEADIDIEYVIDPSVTLNEPCVGVISYPMWLHFSSPGKYEICFYLECPEVPCTAESAIVAEECMPCSVYQWKDAQCIPLYRKWNLISLPLVPLVDPPIDEMLDAYPLKADVMSIWYYDRCENYPEGQWYVWPTPTGTQEALTDLVDGKSYWVRIKYDAANPAGSPAGWLWTWGTPQPTPPASPSAYEVCEGWNMVGLTGHQKMCFFCPCPTFSYWGSPIMDDAYLWNWFDDGWPEYSGIYGWDPDGFGGPGPQAWWSVTPVGNLLPRYYTGEGYWIAFENDGMIYPP